MRQLVTLNRHAVLHGFRGRGTRAGWPCLSEQQRPCQDVPHTGMAVTIDLLDSDLHRASKVDVGEPLSPFCSDNTLHYLQAGTPGVVLTGMAHATVLVSGHSRRPHTILLTDHRIVVIVFSDYSRMTPVSLMLPNSLITNLGSHRWKHAAIRWG